MAQKRIKATFMRGGTSKAVMFQRRDLPADRADWDPIFLAVMGSPDPFGRQLDGMGGGISSLSKVCIIGPPSHPEADVDYTFAQVTVTQASVDYGGNCGNMSSAVGPYAVEEGLVTAPRDGVAVVRIHNTNTGKIIRASFEMADGIPLVEGGLAIDGVAGSGSPIGLDFLDPGGSRTGLLLPTARPVDELCAGEGRTIPASLIDAANPCVFVRASDFGMSGVESPDALEGDGSLMEALEETRRAASVLMGITGSALEASELLSVPKIALVSEPVAHELISGRRLSATEFDICVRMLSIGRPHRAIPITGAICLAVALHVPGTVPATMTRVGNGMLRIAHPSGVVAVDAKVTESASGGPWAEYGRVYRTARRLFEGQALYCDRSREPKGAAFDDRCY